METGYVLLLMLVSFGLGKRYDNIKSWIVMIIRREDNRIRNQGIEEGCSDLPIKASMECQPKIPIDNIIQPKDQIREKVIAETGTLSVESDPKFQVPKDDVYLRQIKSGDWFTKPKNETQQLKKCSTSKPCFCCQSKKYLCINCKTTRTSTFVKPTQTRTTINKNCQINFECTCCKKTKLFFCPSSSNMKSLIPSEIGSAKRTIWISIYRICMYSENLQAAHKRGVEIVIIADDTKDDVNFDANHSSTLDRLEAKQIKVIRCKTEGLMHNKFAIFDQKILIQGSMNWTWNGIHKNNEAIVCTKATRMLSEFIKEFERLRERYETRY